MIKYFIIFILLILFLFLLKNRTSIFKSAVEKIVIVLFFMFAIYSLINPDITTNIANYLGVGRGTDLIYYLFMLISAYMNVIFIIEIKRNKRMFLNHLSNIAVDKAISQYSNWKND